MGRTSAPRAPDGWDVAEFGKITRLATGMVLPTELPYCDLPHVGPENIEGGTGRLAGVRTAREVGLLTGKYLFDGTALVYAKIRPNLNKVCRPNFSGLCSADAYPVWPDTNAVSRDYLFHYMLSAAFVRQSVAASMRTGMPKINRDDLCRLRVLLPPLKEQEKISAILDAWDRAIEQTSRLIEAKRRLKAGLMQLLLTGRRRFPEFITEARMRATRFGPVPADWDYPPVGSLASEVTARNADGRDARALSCTKYDGLVDSLEYFGRRIFSEDTSGYKVVKRGQFAYATNHIEEGSIGLLDSVEAGLVSPMYTVFETDSRVHAPFLYKLFKTELYRRIFQVNTSASVNRRGGLRWADFARIHVPLPAMDEQKRISDCIDACETEIRLLRKQLHAVRAQERALMQKLLTGQIRVKV